MSANSFTHRQYDDNRMDGMYLVHITFLENQPQLGDSRRMAIQQFHRMEKRMHADHNLLEKYVEFMEEYERLGHMEVDEGEVREGADSYYIPHHAVLTKFRVVFNASARTTNGVSLNDTHHIGPTVHDKLAHIIFRFR